MGEYHNVTVKDDAKAIVGDQYNFLFLESVPSRGLNLEELTGGLRDFSYECDQLKRVLFDKRRETALKALRKDVETLVDRVSDLQFHLAEDVIPCNTGWHKPAFELQQFISSYSYMLEDVRHQLQDESDTDDNHMQKVASRCRSSLADLSLKLRVAIALFCAFQSTVELSMHDAERMTIQLRELIETIEDEMSPAAVNEDTIPLSQSNLSDIHSDRDLIKRRFLRQSLLSDAQSLRTVSMQVSSYLASLQTSDKSSGGVRLSSTLSSVRLDETTTGDSGGHHERTGHQRGQRAGDLQQTIHPQRLTRKIEGMVSMDARTESDAIQDPPTEISTLWIYSSVQKDLLSKALAKANQAVLLDNSYEIKDAIEAYHVACEYLENAFASSRSMEDKRKMSAIRTTYQTRILELYCLVDRFSKSDTEKSTGAIAQTVSSGPPGQVVGSWASTTVSSIGNGDQHTLRVKSPIRGWIASTDNSNADEYPSGTSPPFAGSKHTLVLVPEQQPEKTHAYASQVWHELDELEELDMLVDAN